MRIETGRERERYHIAGRAPFRSSFIFTLLLSADTYSLEYVRSNTVHKGSQLILTEHFAPSHTLISSLRGRDNSQVYGGE